MNTHLRLRGSSGMSRIEHLAGALRKGLTSDRVGTRLVFCPLRKTSNAA